MAVRPDDKDFFEYTEKHRFAPMYPLLAKEIVDKFGITAGTCLDIGTGNCAISIELSKITDLCLIALDLEPEVIEMARRNCELHGVSSGRVEFVVSPVERISLPDRSADLIISRGSIPFWDDHVAAFREIDRVLAPGGAAMVGCGFSRYQTLEQVKDMRPVWSPEDLEKRTRWKRGTFLADTLRQAAVSHHEIVDDGYGTWVEIRKPVGN